VVLLVLAFSEWARWRQVLQAARLDSNSNSYHTLEDKPWLLLCPPYRTHSTH